MIVIPSRMGRLNQRALLACLQRLGMASRAELAKALGMSQPTSGKIVDELLRLGVVEEVAPVSAGAGGPEQPARKPRLGRPGRMLRLNRSTARLLAVHLGVTETGLAGLPVGVEAEGLWQMTVPTPGTAEEWVGALREAARGIKSRSLWGVIVSVPGVVNEEGGEVLFSPNLHWTEHIDLRGLVAQVWRAPVVLLQEERGLALGHQYVEPDAGDFLLVDFGDGVGGAVIVGGRLQANPLPLSGELGHTPVAGNRRACGCGATGCLETLVSKRGLLQSLAAAHPGTKPAWASLERMIRDRGVQPWLVETLEAAAVVIAGALNVLGLRQVVVTGSLTELPSAVMEHLTRAVVRGSMWARFGEVSVQAAPRRRMAGMIAAGLDRLVLPVKAQGPREEAAPLPAA